MIQAQSHPFGTYQEHITDLYFPKPKNVNVDS